MNAKPLAAAVIATLALSGCAPSGTESDPIHIGGVDDGIYRWVTAQLPDSRQLHCIAKGAEIITCDWTHASGSDDIQ